MNTKHMAVFYFLGALLLPLDALAYLDPGTGSALLQGVIGAIAAIGIVLKLYWHRFLRLLGLRKKTDFETDKKSKDSENTN
ncbi:MAG: hypothetical protein WCX90_08950 [Thiohalomonadaceae bacterium]